jgi:hypothetical protein
MFLSLFFSLITNAVISTFGFNSLAPKCELQIMNLTGYDFLRLENRRFGDLCVRKTSFIEKSQKQNQYFLKLSSLLVRDYWYSFYLDEVQNKTMFIAFDSKQPVIKYIVEIKRKDFENVKTFYNSLQI